MEGYKKKAEKVLKDNGLYVDTKERVIFVPERGVGLGMWRAIDCLCNYFKYRWVPDYAKV